MRFLLFDKIVTITSKSPDDVVQSVASQCAVWDPFIFPNIIKERIFGRVKSRGFQVIRSIDHRNSFLPVVSGQIEPCDGGSKVTLTVRPTIFVSILLIFVLFFCLSSMVSILCRNDIFGASIPLVVAVVSYLISWFLFWNEVPKILDILRDVIGYSEAE
jgi:hypothetical protein